MQSRIRTALLLMGLPFLGTGLLAAQSKARVVYDEFRIPHIYPPEDLTGPDAAHLADRAVFHGLGYSQVRDFPLKTVDSIFRGAGRLAELWGDKAQQISNDRAKRHYGVRERAQARIEELSQTGADPNRVLSLLRAYVDGVEAGRAWWRAHPDAITALVGEDGEVFEDPVPFPVIEYSRDAHENLQTQPNRQILHDAIEHIFSADFSVELVDVVALGIDLNAGTWSSFDLGDLSGGTNLWMVRNEGSVVLMNDSHVPIDTGGIHPYFVHMAGGTYDVTGFTVPGFPCILAGFNDHLAWGTAVGGEGTVALPALGALTPLNLGNTPLVQSTWSVTLDAPPLGGTPTFSYGAPGGTQQIVPLQTDPLEIVVWDGPLSAGANHDTTPLNESSYSIPTEDPDIVSRYPIVYPELAFEEPLEAPLEDETVLFRQHAILGVGGYTPWEFLIGTGMAEDTGDVRDVLERAQYVFGKAINLMVADRLGDMHFRMMARVPIQGSEAQEEEPWLEEASPVYDGSDPGFRWQGYHEITYLPNFDDAEGDDQVWITCNATFTEVGSGQTFTPSVSYIHRKPFSTWRQESARRRFAPLSHPIHNSDSELLAKDTHDVWMDIMWPFFEVVLEDSPSSARVAFKQFLDENANGFDASIESVVTVFTTRLRELYRLSFGSQICPYPHCLTEDQKRLGFDATFVPGATGFPDPAEILDSAWAPNKAAMELALESVVDLFVTEDLDNVARLTDISNDLDSSNWVPYHPTTPTSKPWDELLGITTGTAWGLVNMLVLTPHSPIFPSNIVRPESGPPYALPSNVFEQFLYGTLLPTHSSLPFTNEFIIAQRTSAYPLAGVADSSLFSHAPASPYLESVYATAVENKDFYFSSTELGSIVPFSVELPFVTSAAPIASFMQGLGSTGITDDIDPDVLVGENDRWRTTAAFVERDWQPLERALVDVEEGMLYEMDVPRPVGLRPGGNNPQSFTSRQAFLGDTLRMTVDLGMTGHCQAQILAFADKLDNVILGGLQVLLVDPTEPGGDFIQSLIASQAISGCPTTAPPGIVVFEYAVPNDSALLAVEIYVQAMHYGAVTPYALTNAQDLCVSTP